MKITQLEIGKIYRWMGGAAYLEIKYLGMAASIENRGKQAASSIGKGWLFQWMHKQDRFLELGINAIQEDVLELEIIHAKCLKSLSVKGKLDPHSYDMRYIKDSFYTFKLTDAGYVCTSTEGVAPIKDRKFNNNFKIN